MSPRPPIALRAKTDNDLAKVFHDWLKSYRNSPGYASIPNETYFWNHHRIIETLWIDDKATWVVACDPHDPTKIYGWLCGQRADTIAGDSVIVHYVYVNKLYRRMGVASALLNAFDGRPTKTLPVVCTALSPAGRELMRDAVWIYNPYLLWARTPTSTGPVDAPPAKVGNKSKFYRSRLASAKAGFARTPGDNEEQEV